VLESTNHFGQRESETHGFTRGPKAPALRIHVYVNADMSSRLSNKVENKVENKTRWCTRGGEKVGGPVAVT
jgi:hypothetical protein